MWKIRHLSNLESPKSHGPHRNSEELGTAPLPDVHLQQLGQFRLQLQGLIQLTSKVRHVQILQPRRSDGKRGSVSATATGINYRIRIGNDKRNADVCLELGSCCFSSFQEGGLASSWGQTTRNCQFQLSLKKETRATPDVRLACAQLQGAIWHHADGFQDIRNIRGRSKVYQPKAPWKRAADANT